MITWNAILQFRGGLLCYGSRQDPLLPSGTGCSLKASANGRLADVEQHITVIYIEKSKPRRLQVQIPGMGPFCVEFAWFFPGSPASFCTLGCWEQLSITCSCVCNCGWLCVCLAPYGSVINAWAVPVISKFSCQQQIVTQIRPQQAVCLFCFFLPSFESFGHLFIISWCYFNSGWCHLAGPKNHVHFITVTLILRPHTFPSLLSWKECCGGLYWACRPWVWRVCSNGRKTYRKQINTKLFISYGVVASASAVKY